MGLISRSSRFQLRILISNNDFVLTLTFISFSLTFISVDAINKLQNISGPIPRDFHDGHSDKHGAPFVIPKFTNGSTTDSISHRLDVRDGNGNSKLPLFYADIAPGSVRLKRV